MTKVVIPDTDGGLFDLQIDGSTVVTDVSDGETSDAVTLDFGAHSVSELAGTGSDLADYTSEIGGDCAADGSISLSAGQNATCVITNTLNPKLPTLTVMKVLLPATDGGLFNLLIDGTPHATDVGDGGTTGAIVMTTGAHGVSELAGTGVDLADYESIIGGDCAADGSISLVMDQNATCVITNTLKPVIDSTPVFSVTQGAPYEYTLTANTGGGGGTPTFTPLTLPSWLTLTDNHDGTATLSGTPTDADVGDHLVSIEVSDGMATNIQSFIVTVEAAVAPQPPTFTIYLPLLMR